MKKDRLAREWKRARKMMPTRSHSGFKWDYNYYSGSWPFTKEHNGWFGQSWAAKKEDKTEFRGVVYGIFEDEIILKDNDNFKCVRFEEWALKKL